MKKLTQMFVAFVLTACFTLGAASVKITKVDTRTNLATPENTGPSLAPSSGRKATTWSAFILSYEIGGEKFSDVDVTWEGIQKNGTKVFTYKKKVSYLDVPAGVNYASIFISPTYIEKEFNGKALDFMKNIMLKVTVSVKGKKTSTWILKGKKSKKSQPKKKIAKLKKKGKDHSHAILNKAESPYAYTQTDRFNLIKNSKK